MDRWTRWLIAAGLIIACAACFRAGEPLRPDGDAGISVRTAGQALPSPVPEESHLRPLRKADRVDRTGTHGAEGLPAARSHGDEDGVALPDAPPASRFLKGSFHRYRPRDPTIA